MVSTGWRIDRLEFSDGKDRSTALNFPSNVDLVYGASNTGKSFAVKSLDFMLGGSKELPSIGERNPYDRARLQIDIPSYGKVLLERSLRGGALALIGEDGSRRTLSAKHDRDSFDNLSNFLLQQLGADGKQIAKDKSGTKRSLSFRDIAHLCITDETWIQSENSPVESGNSQLAVPERNVFKFLLTGIDDSALVPEIKRKDFNASKGIRSQMLQDMIENLDSELAADFPNLDQLESERDAVESEVQALQREATEMRSTVKEWLERKRALASAIAQDQQRVTDISSALQSFEDLRVVYTSDIDRLETLEEVGFLLSLSEKKDCPVCGAPPDAQTHAHGLDEIDAARKAAFAEIAKIKQQRLDLEDTIKGTTAELSRVGERLMGARNELIQVERELLRLTPNAEAQQRRLVEVLPRRDHILRGLDLVDRRAALIKDKERIEQQKYAKPKPNVHGGLPLATADEFAETVSKVLEEWAFPGRRKVTFDEGRYDLIIDGKHRRDNGKGVRAITHAAFKVALLLFCRERSLPHPGFVVLDTPLLTYRDPIKSRAGSLTSDEQALRNTDLKERFFAHLASVGAGAQFLIFENVDPPTTLPKSVFVETFTNDTTVGRQGLL